MGCKICNPRIDVETMFVEQQSKIKEEKIRVHDEENEC